MDYNLLHNVWVVPYNDDSTTVPMKSKESKVVKEDMMGVWALDAFYAVPLRVYVYIPV